MMPQPKDWLDKLFTRTMPNDKELQAHYGWQQRDTAYKWYGNGMLKSVRTPEGATIRFEYDALGRRTLKEMHATCLRYVWDGNVLLHEWSYFSLSRTRARQEVFVFILHLFTGMPQMVVVQRVKGEGFLFLGSRWGWWGSPR